MCCSNVRGDGSMYKTWLVCLVCRAQKLTLAIVVESLRVC